MRKIKVTLEGYEVLEKVVKEGGNSGRIYLPKSWVGKRVKVVLLDPLEPSGNLERK
jgi:putative transposon-encoded protein